MSRNILLALLLSSCAEPRPSSGPYSPCLQTRSCEEDLVCVVAGPWENEYEAVCSSRCEEDSDCPEGPEGDLASCLRGVCLFECVEGECTGEGICRRAQGLDLCF